MNIDFRFGEICLQPNQPISLTDAKNMDIICTGGKIWITVSGEAGDTILHSGESFRVQGDGHVLVESLGAGKIQLVKPPHKTWWQKIHSTGRLSGAHATP